MFTSCGSAIYAQPRTFCRTVRRVAGTGKVKDFRSGAEEKSSLNRALSTMLTLSALLIVKSVHADPKPGDLSMSRMKLP